MGGAAKKAGVGAGMAAAAVVEVEAAAAASLVKGRTMGVAKTACERGAAVAAAGARMTDPAGGKEARVLVIHFVTMIINCVTVII